MKESFFEERGLYYRTSDIRPERKTLLFIHGLSGSSAVWKKYEAFFEGQFNIVSPDLRGHGRSLKPGTFEDYTIEAIANDVVALLRHLNISSYIPISHSLSTIIALELLKQAPSAPSGVFLSPLYDTQNILLTKLTRILVHIGAAIAKLFSYGEKPGIHTDYAPLGRVWDWSPRLIVREIPNTTWHVWLFCLDHLYAKDFNDMWHALTIPALVIHGRKDTISPISRGRKLAKRLPQITFVELPNGNHVSPLPYNDFEQVKKIMSDYLMKI